MINKNLIENTSKCIVIMKERFERLTVECTEDSLRITDQSGFIKLHSFAPQGKGQFRITIIVEAEKTIEQLRAESMRSVQYD